MTLPWIPASYAAAAPRTFSCAACRKFFEQAEMEQVKADGADWGLCKECFKYMWEAGREKLRGKQERLAAARLSSKSPPEEWATKSAAQVRRDAALLLMKRIDDVAGTGIGHNRSSHTAVYQLLMTHLRDFERQCRSANAMDRATFIEEYGTLLVFADQTRRVVRYHGDRVIAFEVFKPSPWSPVLAVQFVRGDIPFGDPHTVHEAAEKLYAFFTGAVLDESAVVS